MTGCVVKYLHIQNRRYAANRAGCLTAMDHNGMYTRNKKDGMKLNEIRHSVKWVGFWIGMAAICCGIIWAMLGSKSGLEFAAGYLIELSLSVDNLFVFMSIFLSFGIREKVQHRVLNWGIIGAIVLRFLFIFFGLKIVNSFSWILYIFGAILIINGIKMMIGKEEEKDPSDSRIIKGVSRVLPMTDHFEGDRFMVKKNGRHLFTPLFAVLCLVECSDITISRFVGTGSVLGIDKSADSVFIQHIRDTGTQTDVLRAGASAGALPVCKIRGRHNSDVHGSETGGTDIRFSHIDDCIDLRDLLCDSVQRDNVRDHIGKRREAINHIIEPAEMQRL